MRTWISVNSEQRWTVCQSTVEPPTQNLTLLMDKVTSQPIERVYWTEWEEEGVPGGNLHMHEICINKNIGLISSID